MQTTSLLRKTAKGAEEIEKRTHKLAGRLRNVLFMVDGQRSVGELLDQAGSLASQLETQLEELIAGGFVEEIVQEVEVVEETPAPEPVPVRDAKPAAAPPPPPQPPKPDWKTVPIEIHKMRLTKMFAETMGMRAMFLTAQLNEAKTHAALQDLIDDIARSIATSSGPKPAEAWRQQARNTVGI